MGLFSDLFSTKPAEDAARKKIAGINQGYDTASDAIDTGLTSANGYYDEAAQPFQGLATKFGAGQDAYNDATGVNGADGIARAGSTFKSLPGYSGGLTTGIDAVNRGAAARGDLGGGNTSADTIKFASDYDASKFGNYLTALQPNLSGAVSAASGVSGVRSGQAGANLGAAGQLANYGWQQGTGVGNAESDAELAKYSASSNFWGALMGGANLALKASGIGGFAPVKAK